MNVLVINRAASWMRVWLVLGFVIMTSPVFGTLTTGTAGGTLTSNPTPINPLASFTLSYAGAGTNFATWAACDAYISYELRPKSGKSLLGTYIDDRSCNGDAAFLALPASLKMSEPTQGNFTITIADLFLFAGVSEIDKPNIGFVDIVIKSQWSSSGGVNLSTLRTLNVDAPQPLGLIGGCYYDQNIVANGLNGWGGNWEGDGAESNNYRVSPVADGSNWVWNFNNVWMRPASTSTNNNSDYQFRFSFDATLTYTDKTGWADFGNGSRITTPTGTTIILATGADDNMAIWNPANSEMQYNFQVRKTLLGVYSLAVTSSDPNPPPSAIDNLGIIGTAYPVDNKQGDPPSSFTGSNWNGSGTLGVVNYEVTPTTSGSDVYWYFNDVWIKPNGSFSFWSGRSWSKSLGYANFPSKIFVPYGTEIVQDGIYLKVTQTPTVFNGATQVPSEAQYDIIVKRASDGTFYLYFLYSRVGLNGSCYYKGNRTDAFKNNIWGPPNNSNWMASTDEAHEVGAEVVASSGTFPACKYRYTYTGIILNRFNNDVNQDGIGFKLDKAGWISYKTLSGGAAGEFDNVGHSYSLTPNIYGLKTTTNDAMYTFVFELDYSGASAPADPTVISVQKTVAADWLSYRMGIQGDGYYLENDTTQAGNWSNNWSRADGKTTYDVAPTVSGNNVTWSFNGVILKNGGVFKFRNGSSWNGRNVGYKSLSYYNSSNSFVSTPLTSDVGATYSNPSGTNIAIANPIIHGASSESKYIYKIDLTLDILTGKYTFLGCNKTTANWLGGNTSWSGADNIETGWRNPLNWDIAVAPLRSTDVVVDKKDHQPIITTNASCNTLTIAATSGANVSVNPNAVLDSRNIVNSVPSNGVGVILNNNVRKQAILYNYGNYTNAGGGVVQVNTVLDPDTTYALGHEVSGANVLSDNYNAQTISVYRYNTTSNGWDLLANGDKLTTADRTNAYENSPVTGYAMRNKSGMTKTLSYSGIPASNSSDITTVIPFNSAGTYSYHHGYYLIANPYTTYLNLEALYAAGGFGAVTLEKTVWVPHRSKTNATTWEMYNFAGSVGVVGGRITTLANRNIPPTQAFWVLSKAASSFTFKPSCRTIATGSGQQSLKSLPTSDEPNDIFRFGSQSVGLNSQMALLFREIGTSDLTTNDSHNFNGLDGIFSMKDGEEVTINLLPLLERDTIIDLGYRYSGSSVSPVIFEAQSLSSFFGSVSVFLEDRDNQMFYDLRQTPNVAVYLTSGLNTTRFALHFGSNNGLPTSKPLLNSQPKEFIQMQQAEGNIVVSFFNSKNVVGVVQVISLSGDVVLTKEIQSELTEVQLPSKNSIYVVRVISNVGTSSEKFMVK